MVYGVIKRLRELGKNIFNDIEVVGYDNLEFLRMFGFELLFIEQNIFDFGKKLVEFLLNIINNYFVDIVIELKLIFKKYQVCSVFYFFY